MRSLLLLIPVLATALVLSPIAATAPAEGNAVILAGSDGACGAPAASSPLFPNVFDVAQSSCDCRDQCFSDFQCVLLHGPGSQCLPVGPCQCKECSATS